MLPHIPEDEPATLLKPVKAFDELYLKQDPTEMSARKADEIERQVTGKWDGYRNAKYRGTKKKPIADE
jgi:hypothetical protein